MTPLNLVEASIEDIQKALSSGSVTSVELAARYLRRVSAYDCRGTELNAIPILNPGIFDEAADSDDRRMNGQTPRPLEGIIYTVKDSYKVLKQIAAAGSPALYNLVSDEDAFLVQTVREAGGVLIGRTNMPAVACGGMQRGIYGRAENPYNPDYLAAAFASGSSNGSAVSTAASMASFGLASETVSSGRSPASNNALVCYTPSKGWLSCRGLWPLYVTCDVPVPHTRSMKDMVTVLDVLRRPDPITEGDFWRSQKMIDLPQPWANAPASLADVTSNLSLSGLKVAVPAIYIGGPTPPGAKPVACDSEVVELWRKARSDLESLGAEVVVVPDWPAVSGYEDPSLLPEGCPQLPKNWVQAERGHLVAHAWNDFIKSFKDAKVADLFSLDPLEIYPDSLRTEPELKFFDRPNSIHYSKLPQYAREGDLNSTPNLEAALRALHAMRKIQQDDWLQGLGCDCVVFPAAGDIGPANADSDFEGARLAWRNGVHYSTGNRAIRHLGIPTVSVPMGVLGSKKVPMNLTFAGKAYDDVNLLRWANAYEAKTKHRKAPALTPALDTDKIGQLYPNGALLATPRPNLHVERYDVSQAPREQQLEVRVEGTLHNVATTAKPCLEATVNGAEVPANAISITECAEPLVFRFSINVTTPKVTQRLGLEATRVPVARDQTMCVIIARGDPAGRPSGWLGVK